MSDSKPDLKGVGVVRHINRHPLRVSEAPGLSLTIWSRKVNCIPGLLLQELDRGGERIRQWRRRNEIKVSMNLEFSLRV